MKLTFRRESTLAWITLVTAASQNLSYGAGLPAGVLNLESKSAAGRFSAEAFLQWKASEIQAAEGVAIGESVHGSEVYEQIERTLTEKLIQDFGYRIVFFETGWNRSQILSRYIDACTSGTEGVLTADVLNGFYYASTELKSLVEFMCQWNRDHASDPVYFRGVDVWDRTWELQDLIEKANAASSLGLETSLKAIRQNCWGADVQNWGEWKVLARISDRLKGVPDEFRIPCEKALSEVEKGLASAGGISSSDPQVLIAGRAYRNLLARWIHMDQYIGRDAPLSAHWNVRDQAQAANLVSFVNELGKKKYVWITHTSHVSKKGSAASWWGFPKDLYSAGQYLRDHHGLRPFTIGTTSFKAEGSQGSFLSPTDSRSLDLLLHQTGMSILGVDVLQGLVAGQTDWYLECENDAAGDPNGILMNPSEHYDVLIYVDHTTPTPAAATPVSPYYP
ncbi:MAG: erythromycin esterase family protein [Bdellovibrionales bacterium]|nr:erythromycin esterase family protein [Bdellovibrionales bacterium]